MIRFLNLKGQIDENLNSFAFYDTVTDTICSFFGEQVFHSKADFINAYKGDGSSRYLSLIPRNFFNG